MHADMKKRKGVISYFDVRIPLLWSELEVLPSTQKKRQVRMLTELSFAKATAPSIAYKTNVWP